MSHLRAWSRHHRLLAMLLLALALCLKAIVPQGYMVSAGVKTISVQLCLDGVQHQTIQLAIPMDGKSAPGESSGSGADKDHCAFSTLGFAALGGADAPLLTLAIAFILALGFAPTPAVRLGWTCYLRPPLRGPPVAA
jgi:hypothetical protein